jgi:small ligand-binding sensory domain FIST
VLREYVDGDPEDLLGADIIHLCVGEPLDPALRAEYGSDYLIRTPLTLGQDKQSLFFPGGLQLGDRIQFTRRDPEKVAANAAQSAQTLARRRPDQSPLAVLQFDCAGRGHMLFGESTADLAVRPLQHAFATSPPWLGFHTFGEIAQIGQRAFYHNYTVVLCALYEA